LIGFIIDLLLLTDDNPTLF